MGWVLRSLALGLVCSCGSSPSADIPAGSTSPPSATGTDPGAPPPGGTSSSGGSSSSSSGAVPPPPGAGRDWKANPAIADVPAPAVIWAMSDIHGGYDRAVALLVANHVLASAPATPSAAQWAAGSAALVVTGDMIDKGPSGLEVLDLLIALQSSAKSAGGLVIVTLGNHEAEFLVNPTNSKATGTDGIDVELSAKGMTPASLASGADPRGAWIRLLPFGARVGGWFFSHAGDTQGRSVAALESALETAVKMHADYNDPEIVGTTSILESRSWFSGTTAATNAAALGVKHIVFGHDPHAIGTEGKIAVDATSTLLRIDCGMSPDVDYSSGMLLRITQQGANDVVEQLDANGTPKSLFTSPR